MAETKWNMKLQTTKLLSIFIKMLVLLQTINIINEGKYYFSYRNNLIITTFQTEL